MLRGKFTIAKKAFWSCSDYNSLLLISSSLGEKENIRKIAEGAEESKHYSISFVAYWLLMDFKCCLNTLLLSERFS